MRGSFRSNPQLSCGSVNRSVKIRSLERSMICRLLIYPILIQLILAYISTKHLRTLNQFYFIRPILNWFLTENGAISWNPRNSKDAIIQHTGIQSAQIIADRVILSAIKKKRVIYASPKYRFTCNRSSNESLS